MLKPRFGNHFVVLPGLTGCEGGVQCVWAGCTGLLLLPPVSKCNDPLLLSTDRAPPSSTQAHWGSHMTTDTPVTMMTLTMMLSELSS